jgi:DNA replication licensing factor MCM2
VNKLIRVRGVVTKRSSVLPQLKLVTYGCAKCGNLMGPFSQHGFEEVKPSRCSSCQSKGPFLIKNEQSAYRDYQRITLQESPGSVPPGRLPRHKEVVLTWDLVDSIRPGEEIVRLHNYIC